MGRTSTAANIAEDVRSYAKARLSDRSLSSVTRTAADALQYGDRQLVSLANRDPTACEIQCRMGCAYCCHMRTLVTPPEALLIADFLRSTGAAGPELMERLARTRQLAVGLTDEEYGKAQIACSLLVEQKCSVYEVRPLECRGYASFDADACRKSYEHYDRWQVPVYVEQFSIFKNVQAGLLMAMVGSGMSHEVLELNAALHIALTEPDAAARWLAGEDIFEPAAIQAGDPARIALEPWSPELWGK